MKKQLSQITLALAFFGTLTAFSQEQKIQPCDTYNAMEEHFTNDPQARSIYEAAQKIFHAQFLENRNNSSAKAAAAFEYTIPVVFHILHTGGAENVSDATCIEALNWVNKDLARQHADASTVVEPYQSIYIPSDIKLMLARKDKDGNCTSGIVHSYDQRTMWDRTTNLNFLYSGITSKFPTSKYLNIIIVKEIVAQQGQVGIIVGYTYKPTANWGQDGPQDAIVYRHDYLSGSKLRNLTHELGHWLNLDHTFGPTNNPEINCGDDGLPDTPPTKGYFSKCPSSLSGNTCSSDGKSNVENIMDYSNCPKNFTTDQTNYMRSALVNFTKRQSLWSPGNIAATDVNNTGFCKPIAEFLSSTDTYTVCAGGTISMKDLSSNGPIDTYNWTADNNAIVAAPNASITDVVFPSIGISNVILSVSNSQGSSNKARTVLVLDNTAGMTGPHMESFEYEGTPAGWLITNPNPGSVTWQRTELAGYDGTASFYMNTSTNAANQVDYLQTPIIDMQNSPNQKFEFAYAYARKTASHNDKFKVQVSTDCAGSWIDMLELSATQMAANSGGVQADPFYPSVEEQWKKIDLSTYPGSGVKWAGVKNSPNLIVRFVFTQGTVANGNNFFLDAILIPVEVSTVGMNEFRRDLQLNVYPNPANGDASIRFRLHDPTSVNISVIDILGKEVMQVTPGSLEPGEHDLHLGSSLPAGIYNINLMVNGTRVSTKLIVQ